MKNNIFVISIIIPVYNHAVELKQCWASIAAQTYKDIEVIVVDDGSIPALNAGQFSVFSFQFSIQFLHQEHVGGSESAQRARNLGFKHAKGEYLMFCDADVVMRPDMLEKMLKVLEGTLTPAFGGASPVKGEASMIKNYPSPLVSLREISRRETGEGRVRGFPAYVYSGFKLGHKAMPSFPFSAERLRAMPYIHMSSLMRRECFSGMDERLKKFQDWDLYLTLLEKGYTGIWIPELLYTILPRKKHGISLWLPGFMYKIPWKKFGIHIGAIERYHEGMRVIKQKHKL